MIISAPPPPPPSPYCSAIAAGVFLACQLPYPARRCGICLVLAPSALLHQHATAPTPPSMLHDLPDSEPSSVLSDHGRCLLQPPSPLLPFHCPPFFFSNIIPQVSLLPSLLPLIVRAHAGYDAAAAAAAAAAISLVVSCHMMSNVVNTFYDFKTGAAAVSAGLRCPPSLSTLCMRFQLFCRI